MSLGRSYGAVSHPVWVLGVVLESPEATRLSSPQCGVSVSAMLLHLLFFILLSSNLMYPYHSWLILLISFF